MPGANESESKSELTAEQLAKVVEQANAGDKVALSSLRQTLDCNPQIWRVMGDLGAIARTTLIASISGSDKLLVESLQRTAAEMQQSLVGKNATPLEKLAAERVVIVWLQLQHADIRCAHPDGSSIGWAGFWTRVQTQAQRRYESAIRHLQAVQRMQGHRPRRQAQVQSSGDTASESPDRTADRRGRGSSASAGAEHEAQVPNTRIVAAATSDQATQDDVAAREAVVPFARPEPAPVSA